MKKITAIFLALLVFLSAGATALAADEAIPSVQAQKQSAVEERSITAYKTVRINGGLDLSAGSMVQLQPNVEYVTVEHSYDAEGNVMEVETSIIMGEEEGGSITTNALPTYRSYDVIANYTWNNTYYCGYVGAYGQVKRTGSTWKFYSCNPKYYLNTSSGVKWFKKSVQNRTTDLLLEGKWYRTPTFSDKGFVRSVRVNSQGYAYLA